jgi:hypothetical protein
MEIDPHFDLWNHFFRVRLLQGSNAEVAVLGGMVIHVKYGHGVDHYFDIPMSKSLNGWWKMGFFLRNDAAAPLPAFIDNRPVPQPTEGTGWARGTSTSCCLCVRSFNSYGRRS